MRFPQLRDDGSLTVAARYVVPNFESIKRLEAAVAEWNQAVTERGVELLPDLSTLPHVTPSASPVATEACRPWRLRRPRLAADKRYP